MPQGRHLRKWVNGDNRLQIPPYTDDEVLNRLIVRVLFHIGVLGGYVIGTLGKRVAFSQPTTLLMPSFLGVYTLNSALYFSVVVDDNTIEAL